MSISDAIAIVDDLDPEAIRAGNYTTSTAVPTLCRLLLRSAVQARQRHVNRGVVRSPRAGQARCAEGRGWCSPCLTPPSPLASPCRSRRTRSAPAGRGSRRRSSRPLEMARATLPDKLAFTEAEAARLLSLNTHQLRDERLRGRITASKIVGNRIAYRREDLLHQTSRRITPNVGAN